MRILAVDDERGIREVCRRALTAAGHRVETCADGPSAAGRLREGWDLVLTDILMPGGIDGPTLGRLARQAQGAHVILMTGCPTVDTAVGAVQQGCCEYLRKPFAVAELLAAVSRCEAQRARQREAKAAAEQFSRFAAPEVARFLTRHPEDFLASGRRLDMTMLFADVRRFTAIAESEPPERVVLRLNEILSHVIESVESEGGVVNKFIGDGLLAVFGAPEPLEDHAACAARAALRAREATEALAAGAAPILRLGFGLNSGEAVAGCLGSARRADYTVIGHAVNVAARLEQEAAAGQILIGPETARRLRGRFVLADRDVVSLEGISIAVPVAELQG